MTHRNGCHPRRSRCCPHTVAHKYFSAAGRSVVFDGSRAGDPYVPSRLVMVFSTEWRKSFVCASRQNSSTALRRIFRTVPRRPQAVFRRSCMSRILGGGMTSLGGLFMAPTVSVGIPRSFARKAKEEPQRFVDAVRRRKCLAQLGSNFNERKSSKKVRILAPHAPNSGHPLRNIGKVDRLRPPSRERRRFSDSSRSNDVSGSHHDTPGLLRLLRSGPR